MTTTLHCRHSALKLHGCGRCSSCNSIKPRSDFYGDSSRSTGISSRCIACETARSAARPSVKDVIADTLVKLAANHPKSKGVIRDMARQLAA